MVTPTLDHAVTGPFPIGAKVLGDPDSLTGFWFRDQKKAQARGRRARHISRAGAYLDQGRPYTVLGYTATGGVVLDGFMLAVSAKHLRLAA